MAKGFSEAVLETYEASISGFVDEFIRKLQMRLTTSQESTWSVVNIAHEANCVMLDIMGRLCFGSAFGFLTGKGDALIAQFHQRAVRVYMVNTLYDFSTGRCR